MNIAILDDYQNVALKIADWSPLSERVRSLSLATTLQIHPLLSRGESMRIDTNNIPQKPSVG
jgi:hypothetical protein